METFATRLSPDESLFAYLSSDLAGRHDFPLMFCPDPVLTFSRPLPPVLPDWHPHRVPIGVPDIAGHHHSPLGLCS